MTALVKPSNGGLISISRPSARTAGTCSTRGECDLQSQKTGGIVPSHPSPTKNPVHEGCERLPSFDLCVGLAIEGLSLSFTFSSAYRITPFNYVPHGDQLSFSQLALFSLLHRGDRVLYQSRRLPPVVPHRLARRSARGVPKDADRMLR